jgi:transcription-repair coupling factor (superfamily II helicase)
MFINRISKQLLSAPELAPLLAEMREGHDATLGIAQSARPLMLASLWAEDPRPCLFIVSGEEAADRAARALAAWLGADVVCRYPERKDWPWAATTIDDAVVGARANAVARLAAGEKCLVVASARSLLRRVPPVDSGYFASATFAVGDEVEFEDVGRLLVGMGYTDRGDAGEVDEPGAFHVHGDAVDVFPAQATAPVRIEFFGDEVDRVRRMLPSTGQTIGELEGVTVSPCREMALTDATVDRARRALYNRAQESSKVAADLELIEARAADPTLDRYLVELYAAPRAPSTTSAEKPSWSSRSRVPSSTTACVRTTRSSRPRATPTSRRTASTPIRASSTSAASSACPSRPYSARARAPRPSSRCASPASPGPTPSSSVACASS